eukprot:scaffold47669_cov58-Phaeocystis_antarctica.AAC.1
MPSSARTHASPVGFHSSSVPLVPFRSARDLRPLKRTALIVGSNNPDSSAPRSTPSGKFANVVLPGDAPAPCSMLTTWIIDEKPNRIFKLRLRVIACAPAAGDVKSSVALAVGRVHISGVKPALQGGRSSDARSTAQLDELRLVLLAGDAQRSEGKLAFAWLLVLLRLRAWRRAVTQTLRAHIGVSFCAEQQLHARDVSVCTGRIQRRIPVFAWPVHGCVCAEESADAV